MLSPRSKACESNGMSHAKHTRVASQSASPASVIKQHLLYVSLGHTTQQQKLQSSPRLGVFKADFPTGLLIRRSVFSTDAGITDTVTCSACCDVVHVRTSKTAIPMADPLITLRGAEPESPTGHCHPFLGLPDFGLCPEPGNRQRGRWA